jgi:hypothetical protein
MEQNFDIFDFELSEEEVSRIARPWTRTTLSSTAIKTPPWSRPLGGGGLPTRQALRMGSPSGNPATMLVPALPTPIEPTEIAPNPYTGKATSGKVVHEHSNFEPTDGQTVPEA